MSIGADLLRFSNRTIILADGECQRVNTQSDNLPFQWSWVKTRKGKIYERHDHYLKWPNYKMSPGAAAITRFNPAWVENGEDPRKVLELWEKDALDPEVMIAGHNFLCFDIPLWMLWRRALGLPPIWDVKYRTLDSHLLARAKKMDIKPDRTNLTAWFYKMASNYQTGIKTSLGVMAEELGIPVDKNRLHDAGYDLEINTSVLWQLIVTMEV